MYILMIITHDKEKYITSQTFITFKNRFEAKLAYDRYENYFKKDGVTCDIKLFEEVLYEEGYFQ